MKKILKRVIHHVKTIPYIGKGVVCPVCNKESRQFRSFGNPKRENAQCVFCGSLERHRSLWTFLQYTDLFDGRPKRMLHVAPELCFESRFNAIGDGYLTADLSDSRAMVKMDITDIQYQDQTFDVIYCSHVLEHVPDDRKAISEFHRVLKDDGWAILLVPVEAELTYEDPTITTPEGRLEAYGHSDHVRIYGLDYVERLQHAGFHVYVNGEIYYCTKQPDLEIANKVEATR